MHNSKKHYHAFKCFCTYWWLNIWLQYWCSTCLFPPPACEDFVFFEWDAINYLNFFGRMTSHFLHSFLLFSFIIQGETYVSFKPSYIWFWLCLDRFIDQVEVAEAMDLLSNTCFSSNTFVDNRNSEANVGINRY